jgi:hypothetical protein
MHGGSSSTTVDDDIMSLASGVTGRGAGHIKHGGDMGPPAFSPSQIRPSSTDDAQEASLDDLRTASGDESDEDDYQVLPGMSRPQWDVGAAQSLATVFKKQSKSKPPGAQQRAKAKAGAAGAAGAAAAAAAEATSTSKASSPVAAAPGGPLHTIANEMQFLDLGTKADSDKWLSHFAEIKKVGGDAVLKPDWWYSWSFHKFKVLSRTSSPDSILQLKGIMDLSVADPDAGQPHISKNTKSRSECEAQQGLT